ncbi:reverse transcriptase domain-containing protein [Tanacetum coccineum]
MVIQSHRHNNASLQTRALQRYARSHPRPRDAKIPVDGGIVTIYNTAAPPKECNTVTCDVTQTQRQHQPSDKREVAIRLPGAREHKLKIRQGYSPVRQKKRGQAPERAKAILEEVHKLVEAGIMREVYYHDWLSNPVMVKKSDGSWRMCVDFTDLNKACPQDCYPLPEIDWKVESLCGYPFKCFLDAYKGYHQIQMAKDDEEKTAFHTSQGVYCYTKMPFGLKNAGATYQRLVDNAFEGQVGRNLEVYVDDLVIKSHTEDELVRDIVETFRALRQINMKLNPKKCTFGATEGMFLGYLIGTDGIKPCPDKTKAVIQLPSPRTMKEVQSLNGKLAGLNRFLSKSADKSLPLFKTLKKCAKKGDFRWTTEAEEAFTQLKQHIAALPTLVAPRPGEELIMYLSATHGAISAVLLTDRDSVQTPVYFVSKALKETEINYSAMEKLILALVFAAKRLRSSATAVKGTNSGDFLSKNRTDAVLPERSQTQETGSYSRMDSSCVGRVGRKASFSSLTGMEWNFTYALRFEFTATNNGGRSTKLLRDYAFAGPKNKSPSQRWDISVIVEPGRLCAREIHAGSCSMHQNTLSVVARPYGLVRGVSFRPGDFVYRANDASHVEDTGKLGKGAYKLRDMAHGRELPARGYLQSQEMLSLGKWLLGVMRFATI